MTAMRIASVVLGVSVVLFASRAVADCPPPNASAVQAAKEGDELKKSNIDGAIEKYQQAREIAPKDARIVWKLALAYMRKESWADVERVTAEAIALAPKNATYVMTRGVALARLQKWADARTALQQAVALDPNLPDAHYELAEVALRLGDEKLALTEYTKAIPLAPGDPVFYASLADLYLRLGFDDHAEKTLTAGEAAVQDESKKVPLYSLHGDVLAGKHDVAGAVAKYEAAKKSCGACTGAQAIAFFNLGAAYASLTPPRKSEAAAQLQSFNKMVCKGAAARRYADQCTQAQMLMQKMGGYLQ
jgi:Flp pilus assembly protein TadD